MSLPASIEGCLDFLGAGQSESGFWSDWQLPPGESRIWTTAYIGYRLSSLPDEFRAIVAENLQRAGTGLRACEFPGGGWGYSEQTRPDADSTSLAILFLHALNHRVPHHSLRRLLEFQQPDGGFSTFTPASGHGTWGQSHPDVTPTALLAILASQSPPAECIAGGLCYVRARQRVDGLWDSFWWTSCLYATEASLAVLRAAGEPLDSGHLLASLRQVPLAGAFDAALLLLCLVRIGCKCEQLAADTACALRSTQLPDGSWPTLPILRLTSREISEPWKVQDPGQVFSDDRRFFTAATVTAALSAFHSADGSSA